MGCGNLAALQLCAGVCDYIVIILLVIGSGGLENTMTVCCGDMFAMDVEEELSNGVTTASTSNITTVGKHQCIFETKWGSLHKDSCECTFSLDELEDEGASWLLSFKIINW
eukprot:374531_1